MNVRQTLKREFWRPEDDRLVVRKQRVLGLGWTINVAAVAKRLRSRR